MRPVSGRGAPARGRKLPGRIGRYLPDIQSIGISLTILPELSIIEAMNRRRHKAFFWLLGVFVLFSSPETALRGEEPAEAWGFIEFGFRASPDDTRAFEYYFEEGGQERLIVKLYRPKEGVTEPATDLTHFHCFRTEYFVGEWCFPVNEPVVINRHSFPLKQPELKREYLAYVPRYFLTQEEGVDIDERSDKRLVIKRLGTVPMPDFPAEILAVFRRVDR